MLRDWNTEHWIVQTSIENISLTLRETLSHSLDRLAEAEITKIKLFQVSARQSVFQDRISQILRNVELSWKILRIFLMMCETGSEVWGPMSVKFLCFVLRGWEFLINERLLSGGKVRGGTGQDTTQVRMESWLVPVRQSAGWRWSPALQTTHCLLPSHRHQSSVWGTLQTSRPPDIDQENTHWNDSSSLIFFPSLALCWGELRVRGGEWWSVQHCDHWGLREWNSQGENIFWVSSQTGVRRWWSSWGSSSSASSPAASAWPTWSRSTARTRPAVWRLPRLNIQTIPTPGWIISSTVFWPSYNRWDFDMQCFSMTEHINYQSFHQYWN